MDVRKIAAWTDSDGQPERVLTRDEMLDDISLYWLTNAGASSSRFYWENNNNNFSAAAQNTASIKVPVAITVFPHEIYQAPKAGRNALTHHSPTTARLTRAATSLPGSNLNCSAKNCGRPSGRCAPS